MKVLHLGLVGLVRGAAGRGRLDILGRSIWSTDEIMESSGWRLLMLTTGASVTISVSRSNIE